MARDELVAVAVGEPVAELAVEGAQSVREPLGLGTAIELLADPLCDRGVPDRIEPDVGVDAVLLLAADAGRNRVEEIDAVCRRGVDRVLEGRLEALAEVEDEVGVGDRGHIAPGELEVVRLDAGRGQVAHVDPGAADLLSGERQWIEGGDDRAIARARVAAAAGQGGDDE